MMAALDAEKTAYRKTEGKIEGTILATAVRARITNTAAVKPPFNTGRASVTPHFAQLWNQITRKTRSRD
jgi:hypothetical protein